MATYPDDPQYRKDHKLELEYIDPTAGPETFSNIVTKPAHGDVTFKALLSEIQTGDEVYLVTWLMNPDLELLRDGWDKPVNDPARQDVRLGAALIAAAKRGARISVIVWDFLNVPIPSSTADLTQLDALPPGDLDMETEGNRNPLMNRVRQLRDKLRAIDLKNEIVMLRHPNDALGSLHQKFWVIRKDKRLLGFVGGINMSQWDWDETKHDPLNPRRNPPEMPGSERKANFEKGNPPKYDPRHDWMMQVNGHGAHALLEEFHERWAQSKVAPPPKVLPKPSDVDAKGTMFVQVSRQWPLDPVPGQILKAYRKAFARAQKYIYVENQYWTSSELTDLLVQRLGEEFGPKLVIVLPSKAEDAVAGLILAEQRFQLNRLIAKGPYGQVLVYQLFRKVPARSAYVSVYVHAKLAIVDDRWMTVGSANTNNRSLGLDSECNAQIAHADFVTGVRKEIWTELTGDPDAADSDPLQGILKGFHRNGVRNEQAKKQNEDLRGFIVPHRPDDNPSRWPRPPEKLRKYL